MENAPQQEGVVLKELTPKDVAGGKLDEQREQVINSNLSPEDTYAAMFYMYSPIFRNGVDRLSSRQLRRMIKFLVEYPLNAKVYKLMTQMEKDLFKISNDLIEAKYGMIIHTHLKAHNQPGVSNDGKMDSQGTRSSQEEQTSGPERERDSRGEPGLAAPISDAECV